DDQAWDAVGRQGLGEMVEYGGILYVVNLYDKKVYGFDIENSGSAPVQEIDFGLDADERPWALTERDGRLYLGVVNDSDVTSGARVLSIDAASGTGADEVWPLPLDYERGYSCYSPCSANAP